MKKELFIWYGPFNLRIYIATWFEALRFSATMTIIPTPPHPGADMSISLGFCCLWITLYYCDHEH